MICNPLSNMQMSMFVWGGWGRMEAERERDREKGRDGRQEREKKKFCVIGQAILCCGLNELCT